MSSPRTWGCFQQQRKHQHARHVFPTHVGVFLMATIRYGTIIGLPHARGGVSHYWDAVRYALKSSPRTWGCFCGMIELKRRDKVFPTHVGVFPLTERFAKPLASLPHARGGVSASINLFL